MTLDDACTVTREAIDFLAGQCHTEDDVAAWLFARGYRGCRAESSSCPFHEYLAEAALGRFALEVVGCGVTVIVANGDYRTIGIPKQIQDFISDFDFGGHHELELRGGKASWR
jgi:hypothetical protein